MVLIFAIKLNDHAINFTKKQTIRRFPISPLRKEKIIEIGPDFLALEKMKDGEVFREIYELLLMGKTGGRQPKRPPLKMINFGFPNQKTVKILITCLPDSGKFLIT